MRNAIALYRFYRQHRAASLNTSAMAAAGSTIAQQVLALRDDAGRADYAIPSQAALQLAAANVPELFAKDWYWSSTQISRYNAFVQAFEHGSSRWFSKDGSYRVRAVRTIPLTPNSRAPTGVPWNDVLCRIEDTP